MGNCNSLRLLCCPYFVKGINLDDLSKDNVIKTIWNKKIPNIDSSFCSQLISKARRYVSTIRREAFYRRNQSMSIAFS